MIRVPAEAGKNIKSAAEDRKKAVTDKIRIINLIDFVRDV